MWDISHTIVVFFEMSNNCITKKSFFRRISLTEIS